VRVRPEAGLPALVQHVAPGWWEQALAGDLHLDGALLSQVGLPMPVLAPAQGFLLHLT
jgi:alpha-galactosidase